MAVVEGAVTFMAKDGMLDSVGVSDMGPVTGLEDFKSMSGVGRQSEE